MLHYVFPFQLVTSCHGLFSTDILLHGRAYGESAVVAVDSLRTLSRSRTWTDGFWNEGRKRKREGEQGG